MTTTKKERSSNRERVRERGRRLQKFISRNKRKANKNKMKSKAKAKPKRNEVSKDERIRRRRTGRLRQTIGVVID